MKLSINGIISWVRSHYDRVLALFAVAMLGFTLFFLLMQMGAIGQRTAQFEQWMQYLTPEHEHVEEVSDTLYEDVLDSLRHPTQLVVGEERTRWFFVPESRFSCTECGHPVPDGDDDCPFCGALVDPPPPDTLDHSGDGIPTWWKVQHGLDPYDAADAEEDWDGDGFTNLEEYLHDTDPNDPDSHPPLIDWLIVDEIQEHQIDLEFRSRVRTARGYRFGINYGLPDGTTRTEFVNIGDRVGGFTIQSYEEILETIETPSRRTVDRSELTVVSPRGDEIVLVLDDGESHVERTVHLRMGREAPQHTFSVRTDDTFTLDDIEYRVIEIDASNRHVILETVPTGESYTVTPEIRPTPVVRQMEADPLLEEADPLLEEPDALEVENADTELQSLFE